MQSRRVSAATILSHPCNSETFLSDKIASNGVG